MKIVRKGWTVVWVKKNGGPLKKQPITRSGSNGLDFWIRKNIAERNARHCRQWGGECIVCPATMEVFLGD